MRLHEGATADAIAAMVVRFLDANFPKWAQKLTAFAADGATVNGCEFGPTAPTRADLTNIAKILQEQLITRGVNRVLLTSWCGAHKHALVWQNGWGNTSALSNLDKVMTKVRLQENRAWDKL